MGCGGSTVVDEDPMAQRSRAIDKQLAQERTNARHTTKILLLGAGESGKSTVLKQMRLRYSDQYSQDELAEYCSIIWSNAIQSLQALIDRDAAETFSIRLAPSNTGHAEFVQTTEALVDDLSSSLVDALRSLARDPAVVDILQRSNEFQLNDSAAYYFANIERITQRGYLPSTEDVLRARVKTTGITENKFDVQGKVLIVVDVGGQRSERRKWLSVFQDVDVLMFLFSVSEFDQALYEDETVRRFEEAMSVFSSICNSPYFKDSLIIVGAKKARPKLTKQLLLNKVDLLADKLKRKRFADFYPDFQGRNTPDEVIGYLQGGLVALHKNPQKRVYCRPSVFLLEVALKAVDPTCATDTKTINVVLAAVQDQILSRLLTQTGMF